MAGKRAAEAPPGLPPKRKDKKQKTATSALQTPKAPKQSIPIRPEAVRSTPDASAFAVVPATPGTIVGLSAKDKREKTFKKKTPSSTQQKQDKPKPPHEPPTSLPLEPHAAILAELQHKYAVRVLSVISSSRMEKRIKAILDHLADGTAGGGEGGEGGKPAKALPGVVLLHARAPDANKLVSIAEIVKRRIRKGHFEAPAADLMSDEPPRAAKRKTKKKKGKDAHAAAVAWYQYDRIYDVKSARKKKVITGGAAGNGASCADDDGGDEEEEEDGFEPAMHRLEAALGGGKSSGTIVTTYMSIILSRTPISELHKNPEISVQCSTDPLEIEYEQFMAEA